MDAKDQVEIGGITDVTKQDRLEDRVLSASMRSVMDVGGVHGGRIQIRHPFFIYSSSLFSPLMLVVGLT